MSNDNRKTGQFKFTNGRDMISCFYEAYPDAIFIDETAWVGTVAKPLDRVLLNMDMTSNHLEELIAEECGF